MKLLLDTHALLWWLADDPQMSGEIADLIEADDSDVMVSVVALWEIAIKHRMGKLDHDPLEVAAAVDATGLRRIGIELAHFRAFARLPRHHGDPFDHLLIAQAIAEDAMLITSDRMAALYPVQVIDCR